jgi:alcohol dehydrogenase
MRQLHLVETGKLAWRESEAPRLRLPSEALVRPLAVARCDLDAGILRGEAPFRGRLLHWLRDHLPESIGQRRLFRNAPFKGPFAFGHEAVAEVVEVGDLVRTVKKGQRVIVPFQISCGACVRCARGLTGSCCGVPERSMYGLGALGGDAWGGLASDLVRVPFADAMLLPAPQGPSAAALASASDNLADGHRAVAGPLAARPRAPVLVFGGKAASVGLYAAGVAVALGAERVEYRDRDRTRLGIAERLGARAVESDYQPTYEKFPITVDASADEAGLSATLRSTEPGGTSTSVGIYYTETTPMPLLAMYGAGITFVTGRVHARNELPALLRLVAEGRFDPSLVSSRVAPWEDAPEAMLDEGPKVVITREAA